MSIKQRIEALEEQLTGQGTCTMCGGLHTRNWAEAMRATADDVKICWCRPCCTWIADLEDAARAELQTTGRSLTRRHVTDPKRATRHTAMPSQ